MASGTSTGKNINLKKYGGTATSLGIKTAAASIPVALPSDGTLPLPSGAATSALQTTQDTSINTLLKPASTLAAVTTVATVTSLTQMNGAAIAMNTGVRAAGVQRVTIATDDLVPVSATSLPLPTGASTAANQITLGSQTTKINDGTNTAAVKAASTAAAATDPALVVAISPNNTVPVSAASLPLPSGAATSALQSTQDTSINTLLKPASTLAAVTTVSTVTSLTQMNGQAISMGTGVRAAGTQRVTIATDDVVPASQSGTWTVQPGNTANTTPWLVTDTPATTGGLSKFHLVGAASTNATNIKASAGQVYSITAFNVAATPAYLKFHNTAGTPTAGTAITDTFLIPGNTSGAGMVINFDKGIAFSTGIGITTVTGIADADTTAIAASNVVLNIYYK